MQEQFDDYAEALRTQNDPERKSQRDAIPGGRMAAFLTTPKAGLERLSASVYIVPSTSDYE